MQKKANVLMEATAFVVLLPFTTVFVGVIVTMVVVEKVIFKNV